MANQPTAPGGSRFDDELVGELVKWEESQQVEFKRVAGDKLTRALESIVAFANTDGGHLILGIEDSDKAKGRDRVYGVEENPTNVDELSRLVATKIEPPIEPPVFAQVGCTLRDGSRGSIVIIPVKKGADVHSIELDGTWTRLPKSNRQMTAEEITRLRFERGKITAETELADVPFSLLETDYWRTFATKRKLTRALPEALQHLGLARCQAEGELRPTRAAVMLFAENPGGLLGTKAGVRVFHYKGDRIERTPTPNLQRPPASFTGPIVTQISDAYQYVLNELATGVQMGPFGFEIVQRYPARVIKEAITNAVIHRDYRLSSDVHIRLFADRIEIQSPGTLPGNVTAQNIREIGSVARNPLIVSYLREFPDPPNLDAGEGVRMMFQTMDSAGLYPPIYLTRATTKRDEVLVMLRNQNRPSVWDQICHFIIENGTIGNAEVREIMKADDTLKASKMIKRLVDDGLLAVANPESAKQHRRYALPESSRAEIDPFFSTLLGRLLGGES